MKTFQFLIVSWNTLMSRGNANRDEHVAKRWSRWFAPCFPLVAQLGQFWNLVRSAPLLAFSSIPLRCCADCSQGRLVPTQHKSLDGQHQRLNSNYAGMHDRYRIHDVQEEPT